MTVEAPSRDAVNSQDPWEGFTPGPWQNSIDVREFILANYTPYTGDAAFLAGYVAAAQTQTGTVAEPTGADEPYRNGFAAGVDYFNQAKGAAVAVVPDAAASTDGVRKVVDAAVISAIGEAARGQFTSSPYYGTLKDGGVDIAPLDASAGDELKAEVEAVRAALINGSVTPPAAG